MLCDEIERLHAKRGNILADEVQKSASQPPGGIETMLRAEKVELLQGNATVLGPSQVRLTGENEQVLTARHILLATGAVPARPPIPGLDLPLFRIVLTLANRNYSGFPLGQKIFCYTDCSHPDGRRFCILSALNRQVVLQAVTLLFSSKQTEIDELVLSAIEELSAMLAIHFVRGSCPPYAKRLPSGRSPP